MDEKSAVKEILAAYEKLIGADKRVKALEKKLADGTITLKEGAELNDLRARAFSKAFSGKVLDIAQGEREGACTALLREGCNDVDELAQAAQRAVLARQGLNLTPPAASFEEKRVYKVAHSLEDTTVPDETIERRARSATENVLRSQYDRNMKKGAETCSAAGLKTYIIRDSGSGCCKWCDEVSGKFAYGTEPKDVYRRHDNCTCTVVYESNRGRQNVWSKQYWSAEKEQEYLRLRDELKAKKMTAAPDVKKPVRLSEKDVQAIINKVGGLTFGGNGGTIGNNGNQANGNNNLLRLEDSEHRRIRYNVIPTMNTTNIVKRQDIHRQGSAEYKKRQNALKSKGQYGPSYLTISDEELLRLVDEFKGTGRIKINKRGEWDDIETIVKNDRIIGVVVNNLTGDEAPTSVFKIHYGKDGIHIVPDYPSKKGLI